MHSLPKNLRFSDFICTFAHQNQLKVTFEDEFQRNA
jgi:hypothetical protein